MKAFGYNPNSNSGGNRFKAIDLFAGCGGLSQGLVDAGFDVVAAIEIGKEQAETYKCNHQSTLVIREDIRNITYDLILEKLGKRSEEIDLLAGCPPCQGFSSLRTLNGRFSREDPRNDLLFEFVRLVKEVHPKSVFLENVPSLMRDYRFSSFLAEMERLGYIGKGRIIDVVDYSVPQHRKRLVYLAGKGFRIPFPEKEVRRMKVKDAIGSMPWPGDSGDSLHDWPEHHNEKVQKIIASIPKNGGSRNSLPDVLILSCHKKTDGFKDVYGRMSWDEPSPTITGGCVNPSKGRFLHPERNGAVTLREAALLQGFPSDYKFVCRNKGKIALMIGNAFPPPVARIFGKTIIDNILKYYKKESESYHGLSQDVGN